MMLFFREDVQKYIPYEIICETMNSSKWKTGATKRKLNAYFSKDDKRRIRRLFEYEDECGAHVWSITQKEVK